LHILYGNIALSSALTAATASAKHLDIKVIKYKQYQEVKKKHNRNGHGTKLQTYNTLVSWSLPADNSLQ